MNSSSDDDNARHCALECLLCWTTATLDAAATGDLSSQLSSSIHTNSCVLLLDSTGSYSFCNGQVFGFESSTRIDLGLPAVMSLNILPVGGKNAATAHVVVGDTWSGWMVLLKTALGWQCISAAFSALLPSQQPHTGTVVLPVDFYDVVKLSWDGYCAANVACDGAGMQQFFHPECRLTYVDPENQVVIKNQVTFCDMVTHRYEERDDGTINPHYSFRHLQKDPRSREATSLCAIQFATPVIAMVTLKVGHAPYLWTDLLTVAKLGDKWWIVHKSSCSEPFLVELKRDDQPTV
jgi:hypothetical protein